MRLHRIPILHPPLPTRFLTTCGLAGLLVILAACTATDELPSPGERGRALVHLWDAKGGPPMEVLTEYIQQEQMGRFDHLTMKPVQIRLESSDNVVFITADSGAYNKDAIDTLVLEPQMPTGLVRLAGTRDGEPSVGTSTRVVFRQQEQLMTMEQVVLVHHGRLERFLDRPKPVGQAFEDSSIPETLGRGLLKDWNRIPSVMLLQAPNGRYISGPNQDSHSRPELAAPAVVALLAALPHPLALPPVPRGKRNRE
jgi:hypothetical protein